MRRDFVIAAGLVLATVAIYAQTLSFEFVNFDDNAYVTRNAWVKAGLSVDGVRAAFTEPTAPVNWSPLVVISYMLDTTLFGVEPAGFHAVNVALQALDVVLVYVLLRSLTGAGWQSALVAALFALHPLRVESVAWVSSRKDVLSAAFGLLALIAYGRFAKNGSSRAYAASVVGFAGALMSKPTWIVLPFLFLLLDFWPLRRLGLGVEVSSRSGMARLLAEKLPFFALCAASLSTTLWYQSGNLMPAQAISIGDRIVHAMVACAWYVVKTFWPSNLSFHYPHPYLATVGGVPWTGTEIALAALLLVSLTACVMRFLHRGYPLVGWLWFLGTLLPVLGLVQYGSQSTADRYTYLPQLGLLIGVVFGGWDFLAPRLRTPRARRVAGATLAAGLLALGSAAYAQTRVWRDSESLFTHGVRVTPRNALAHKSLATEYFRTGRYDAALRHCKMALDLHPAYSKARRLLAVALERRAAGEAPPPPPPDFLLDGGPSDPVIHEELAKLFYAQGDAEAAIHHARRALELAPESPNAHWQLGILLRERGDLAGAASHFQRLLELAPDSQAARDALEAAERALESAS